jgi:hypothetical protein
LIDVSLCWINPSFGYFTLNPKPLSRGFFLAVVVDGRTVVVVFVTNAGLTASSTLNPKSLACAGLWIQIIATALI